MSKNEFYCEKCSFKLKKEFLAITQVCPACGYVNDVDERIAVKVSANENIASVIKFGGEDGAIVWKHPIENFNWGTQLIVHESQEALFFKDGQALDLFGAGRYTLETQHLPLVKGIMVSLTNNPNAFQSHVYFINKSTLLGIKWGTDSKVRVFDPTSGLHIELGAGGQFNLSVTNARKLLLKLVGTSNGVNTNDLLGGSDNHGFFRSMIMMNVKSYLAQTIKDSNINILEIDAKLVELSQGLKDKINVVLEEYGLIMPEFFVSRIVTPDDDKNFIRLKEQFAAEYLLVRNEEIKEKEAIAAAKRKAVEAETEAKMKIISAQGDAEAYRLHAQAEAAEMQMKGYTYQDETARQVGMEAMQNGIISENGGSGSSMIGDLAGLGVALGTMGGVVGMTNDVLKPVMNSMPNNLNSSTDNWNCECGNTNISGNFCNTCGNKKTETWDCTCGYKSVVGNFCNNCGLKKELSWNCECGNLNINGNFCNNCGRGRN